MNSTPDVAYVTRSGKPVRVLCFDRPDPQYPIVGLVDNNIFAWTSRGKAPANWPDSWDLCETAPEPRYEDDGPRAA